MRPRKHNRNLPARLYLRHGRYYHVIKGEWFPLSKSYADALTQYASREGSTADTMPSMIDRFIITIASKKTPKTEKEYKRLGDKMKKVFSAFKPSQVKPHHIAKVIDHEAQKHPTQANRIRQFLSTVFAHAVRWGVTDSNPCRDVKGIGVKKRDRYITDDEFKAVKSASNKTIAFIMDFCYFTGQRISDVLKVKRSDITDEGVYFQQGKTGKRLIVEMTPELKQVIERVRGLYGKVVGISLFQGRGGKQYTYFGVSSMFRRACQKAKVSDFHIHDIRAKSLTDLDRQGGNAQTLGGHKNRSTTEHYIKTRIVEVAKPPKAS